MAFMPRSSTEDSITYSMDNEYASYYMHLSTATGNGIKQMQSVPLHQDYVTLRTFSSGTNFIFLYDQPMLNKNIIQVMNDSTYEFGIRWWYKTDMRIFTAEFNQPNYFYVLGGWIKIDSNRYMPTIMTYDCYKILYITQWYSDPFVHKWFIGFQDDTQPGPDLLWISNIALNAGLGVLIACTNGDATITT